MASQIVVVSGNLGVGKTTLVDAMGKRLGWRIIHESVDDNPYLRDYYADIARWAFHLQVYFLGHRSEQHFAAQTLAGPVIFDRSIYEDANVFAPALRDNGSITERDFRTYLKLYDLLELALPKPDLLIHLTAPLDVLLERIGKRGLRFDLKGINREYLAMIETYYERWLESFTTCPILRIDTSRCDYAADSEVLDNVINKVARRL